MEHTKTNTIILGIKKDYEKKFTGGWITIGGIRKIRFYKKKTESKYFIF